MASSSNPPAPPRAGRTVSAARLAQLVGDFDRSPAWSGLAEALRELVADGRLPHDTRLPSERDLTEVIGVSRTTVTRAYTHLRDSGWALARTGAGTWLRLPTGPRRSADRVLSPRGALQPASGAETIDLTCAAAPAPPGVLAAYQAAVTDLPGLLVDHGYFPGGLPELTELIAAEHTAAGLPTTPEQIMVTPGALAATAVVAHAMIRTGDRVLVETPVYPNAPVAFVRAGARLVNQPLETRDPASTERLLRSSGPRAAYFVPDFQNPTGSVMDDEERAALAGLLTRHETVAVVDECHRALNLDGRDMPLPLASHVEAAGGRAVTLGSMSKAFWGGLRLGWLRAPVDLMDTLTETRLALDLGSPVVEQLTAARLLADPQPTLQAHLGLMRERRDALVGAVREHLPDWDFTLPAGGAVLWCRLPLPRALAVADAAEARGVVLTPGPMFCPECGYRSHVRLPWTQDPAVLVEAVRRIADAWAEVRETRPGADDTVRRMAGRNGWDAQTQRVVVA